MYCVKLCNINVFILVKQFLKSFSIPLNYSIFNYFFPLEIDFVHIAPQYRGSYRLRIYEKPDFSGNMMEFMDDCPCVSDRFHHRHVYSCNVMNGYFVFYEYPNYRGRQYFLRPGEYRKYRDWCATCAIVGSFRRVTEF